MVPAKVAISAELVNDSAGFAYSSREVQRMYRKSTPRCGLVQPAEAQDVGALLICESAYYLVHDESQSAERRADGRLGALDVRGVDRHGRRVLRGAVMTPRKARAARSAAWRLALAEGRIVSYNDGKTMQENRTVHDAQMLVFALRDNGDTSASIVSSMQRTGASS
jgi:hypothetical protein